jgi:hypothetical protein
MQCGKAKKKKKTNKALSEQEKKRNHDLIPVKSKLPRSPQPKHQHGHRARIGHHAQAPGC